jgi:hypothetical protein
MTDTQPEEKPEGVNGGAAAIAPRRCTGQLVFLGLEVRDLQSMKRVQNTFCDDASNCL